MSPEAKEQRKDIAVAGGQSSALARRTSIQNKMAEKLELILKHMTEEEIAAAAFRDKATAMGIAYDKLYRDQHALPNTAVQINIQTMGQDPTKVDPLTIDVMPIKKNDTDVSPS